MALSSKQPTNRVGGFNKMQGKTNTILLFKIQITMGMLFYLHEKSKEIYSLTHVCQKHCIYKQN